MALRDIGRTGQAMDFRNDARANPIDAMQTIRKPQQAPIPVPVPMGSPQAGPMPVPTQVPMGGPQAGPMPVPTQVPMGGPPVSMKQTLNEVLTKAPVDENGIPEDSAGTIALINLIKKGSVVNDMVAQTRRIEDSTIGAYTGGGLMQLAAGGEFRGRVPGDGHGMEDNVYMPIRERNEDVGTLAVSPSEYVVDSYTMAALGNGNADEGADVMDEVVEQVRERAYGDRQQPNEINGLAALRPMLERV
jgi:hypothetical protein